MALEQTFVTPSVYSNVTILDVSSLKKGEENGNSNPTSNTSTRSNNDNGKTRMQQSNVPSCTSSASTTYKNNMGPSPFPPLEAFIRNHLAGRKGFPGEIRAWTVTVGENESSSSPSLSVLHEHDTIIYQMKNNRWCENIQRCHKSNNIMWNVSLDNDDMTYWQSCHDPDCRLVRFRGDVQVLPKDVQDSVRNILLDRSIEVDDEFEAALASLEMPVTVPLPVTKPVGNDPSSTEGDGDVESMPRQEIGVDHIRVGDDPFEDDDEFVQILAKALRDDPSLCP